MGACFPFQVGDLSLHRIVEQEGLSFPAHQFFPGISPELLAEQLDWLKPRFVAGEENRVVLCIQSYLIETPKHKILIDACVGNHKSRPKVPHFNMLDSPIYEQNLAKAGTTVDDIDFVMCTHMHVDHVGWNTKLENGRWVPRFPNARYLFSAKELAHWTERAEAEPDNWPWIIDSVLPVVEAGRVDTIASDQEFDDGFRLLPTPGHTFDHFSIQVPGKAHDVLITGDMIHSPIQARIPELGMFSDYDSAQAGRTRRQVFGEIADTSVLVCTSHFPSPSTGRIVTHGEAFNFVES